MRNGGNGGNGTLGDCRKNRSTGGLERKADIGDIHLLLSYSSKADINISHNLTALHSAQQSEVGFYYWQIIRLSKGLAPEPQLGTFKAFLRHMTNDFKLNMKAMFPLVVVEL
jgi:hypothetical protein